MINLLPTETKQTIAYARRNYILKRWALAAFIGLIGVLVVIASGQLFISRSTNAWQSQVNSLKEQLELQKLDETQARVTEMSDSIKLASQVLSEQVLISKLLTQVSAVLPSGTSLDSLNITAVEGGIDLAIVAVDYQSATQAQLNLSDPENRVFEKADIVNITCTDDPEEEYPCTAQIRALFSNKNSFGFGSDDTGDAR